MFIMKKFLALLAAFVLILSCGVTKPTPGTNSQVNIRDSVVVHEVDSVVVIPVEKVVDVVPQYDTLTLETSKAKAIAYVDTTVHMLKGKIENKTGTEYKYIYKDKIVYRDSVTVKEVPIPYEVVREVTKIPKAFWWLLAATLILGGWQIFKIVMKIKSVV